MNNLYITLNTNLSWHDDYFEMLIFLTSILYFEKFEKKYLMLMFD